MRTKPRKSLLIYVGLPILAAACTPEPLDFPDWTIPVPEGTPIIEYASVPMEERIERIELVEDLVIGGGETGFYRPADIAVDSWGRVFVADIGHRHVQVYNAEGEFLHSIGQSGQGPGEFTWPGRIAIARDRLVVFDYTNSRFSYWSLDGEHIEDYGLEEMLEFTLLDWLPDGSLLVSFNDDRSLEQVVACYSAEGEEISRYLELDHWPTPPVTGRSPVDQNRRTIFAVSPDGRIYLADSVEYQVLAVDIDGDVEFGLRVAWDRQPYTQGDIERRMEPMKGRRVASEFDWPERWNALAEIHVDGHGHLYVFPAEHLRYREDVTEWPVDVYSADGRRIFSGLLSGEYWSAAWGDYVYVIGTNPSTDERQVVRYRLVEPF